MGNLSIKAYRLFDSIKSFVLIIITMVVLVLVAGMIVHNFIKLDEVPGKYKGEYLNGVAVNNKRINVYKVGEDQNRKILIFPEYGVYSPVLKYRDLVNKLGENYCVYMVEPLGYGFSSDSKEDRTNVGIAEEIHDLVKALKIENEKYILMPMDYSSLYVMEYSKKYGDEIHSILAINSIYPGEVDEFELMKDYKNLEIEAKVKNIVELFGYNRYMSYLTPEKFDFDYYNSKNYSESEIKLYRKLIAKSYMTKGKLNEAIQLNSNMNALKNFKYDEELNVLLISSEDYRTKISDEIANKKRSKELTKLQGEVISSMQNQKVADIGSLKNWDNNVIDEIENLVDYINSENNEVENY